MMTTAIWWVRRDLRLRDNQALTHAMAQTEQVIPVFILDPALLNSPYLSEKRLSFLFSGLSQLAADLEARGSQLLFRRGSPADEIEALLGDVVTLRSLPLHGMARVAFDDRFVYVNGARKTLARRDRQSMATLCERRRLNKALAEQLSGQCMRWLLTQGAFALRGDS